MRSGASRSPASPKEAAERLAAYHAAGARHAVVGISGGDRRAQVDLLAEVRDLLC